ncbi:fimbrial protein [Ewingella americana]|uniref:fimbrial protein n=1 Tax=Ewingella americana TaxID=41202 RepID=UPI00163B1880|nr:fimbrial protein [Ewingella americana]QMV52641.1 fimbrial protein [Ewingella americana]
MKIKFNKAFLLCLAACPLLLISKTALADCSLATENTKKTITNNVTFGNVIVQRDTPVGSVIASENSGEYNNGKNLFLCSEAWVLSAEIMRFTTISSYGNKVYNTNIPGVGIKIAGTNYTAPYTLNFIENQPVFATGWTVSLIKTSTGSVGAGTLTTGDIFQIHPQPDPSYNVKIAIAGSTTITPVACSVNNTVINVSLDDAVIADFKGVGSTAKPKDFNIDLDCDSGTNIKMQLDGNSAGPAGVLSLNAGEHQASGIGIQVLNGTTPVVLGNQLDLGTAGKTGDMQIPLVAQYYQTDASIVAGLTNATATFTMVYN